MKTTNYEEWPNRLGADVTVSRGKAQVLFGFNGRPYRAKIAPDDVSWSNAQGFGYYGEGKELADALDNLSLDPDVA